MTIIFSRQSKFQLQNESKIQCPWSLAASRRRGFFFSSRYFNPTTGDGLESKEGSGDEFENVANHLSGRQLLTDTDICIYYGDVTTFDTFDDQTDEWQDQSKEKENNPELEEVGNDSEGDNEKADKHSLSNKIRSMYSFYGQRMTWNNKITKTVQTFENRMN